MKLSDIDVRDLSTRLEEAGERLDKRRSLKVGTGDITTDMSAGMIAGAIIMFNLARVLKDIVDEAEKPAPDTSRKLDV